MNNKFSDEQLDQIMRKLVKSSALSEEMIDEIAVSPQLWRNIRNNVDEQKSSEKTNWFFAWRWQFAAFGLLICCVCAGLFLTLNASRIDEFAQTDKIEKQILPNKEITDKTFQNSTSSKGETKEKFLVDSPKIISPEKIHKNNMASGKFSKPTFVNAKKNDLNISPKPAKNPAKTTEVKTDFIALSSSPTPESGHILKVQVPRSMMVSLGVANDVENNSELVNAEIVVGDDGLTHAIRFVQTGL